MMSRLLAKLSKKNRRTIMLFMPPLLIVAVFLLTGPVLVQTYLFADLFGNLSDPPLTILNPLRDKAPEMVANSFLTQLQSEEPANILRSVTKDDTELAHICLAESKHRLKTWNRYTREDTGEEVILRYWPHRENYDDGYAPQIIIRVAKIGGNLKVVSYNAAY
jgi:hypothetical protein